MMHIMTFVRYPILIEEGTEAAAFGVVVPDLPGCFSAGDTLNEAVEAVKEAAAAWIDAALDSGLPVPPPRASRPCAICEATRAGLSASSIWRLRSSPERL